MSLSVAKFGGTSVADYEAMCRCINIVLENPSVRIIVVSAQSGVTNRLVDLCRGNLTATEIFEHIAQIGRIEQAIIDRLPAPEAAQSQIDLMLTQLQQLAQDANLGRDKAKQDQLLSYGERMSSVLFTEIMQSQGIIAQNFDATRVIKTDARYGKATPNTELARQCAEQELVPLIDENLIVTQGFIGADPDGGITTLGRGGSDYSAALFAEAVAASELQIWTDVVGIYTTDPRLTQAARPIPEISFDEAAEMATFGAKILHPATLIPAMRQNIRVFVGSSREPHAGGTYIAKQVDDKPAYRAIALRKQQTLVTVKSPQMLHATGFLAEVFAILARHQISVDLITTSEISVAMTIDSPSDSPLEELTRQAIEELQALCEVSVERDLALVAIIGNHLHGSAGVTGSAFAALEQQNMRMICHGASPHNLCFLVQEAEAAKVVEDLHLRLFAEV